MKIKRHDLGNWLFIAAIIVGTGLLWLNWRDLQSDKNQQAAAPPKLNLKLEGDTLILQSGSSTVARVQLPSSVESAPVPPAQVTAAVDNDHQTLSISGSALTISNGNSVMLPSLQSAVSTPYFAGDGLQLVGTTFSRSPGSASGQIELWNGASWQLLNGGVDGQVLTMDGGVPVWDAATAGENDGVIGNEVLGPTGANSGLLRSGAGSAASPFTLAINQGSGLTVAANQLRVSSPTCNGAAQKLGWSGVAFVCGADANTAYSAGAGLSLAGTVFTNTGTLGLSVNAPLQSSGGQNPILSCPTCLTSLSGSFTVNGTSPGTISQTIINGANLSLAAGLNMVTTGSSTNTVSFATVNNPTFSGLVTAGAVATDELNPAGTLSINGDSSTSGNANVAGNLTLDGAFLAGGIAGSLGDLLVSQGSSASPQWQTIDFNSIADSRISLQKGAPDGLATLGPNGKVLDSQLPQLAITNTFVETFLDSPGGVADSCTELATAAQGDICVVTDTNQTFILSVSPASTVGNWVELLTSASVVSVNNQTGSVVLTASNGLSVVNSVDFRLGGTLSGATTIAQAGNNLALTGTGNFGIGVAVPTQKFDVAGNVRFSGSLMPAGSTGSTGQVLVSQGAGSAPVWSDPTSLSLGAVRDATPSQGLVRSGAGNVGNPYTLGLQACTGAQILVSNGAGWNCGNQQAYFPGTGLSLAGNTFNLANTGVAPGTYGSSTDYPIIAVDAQGRITTAGLGTVPTYAAGTGISLTGNTFGNTGLIALTGNGPILATAGQSPTITFADGTTAGEMWVWDGSSWQLDSQTFVVNNSGNDFTITSNGGLHTFGLPDASTVARGVVTSSTQTFGGVKTFAGGLNVASGALLVLNGTTGGDPVGSNGSMYYNSTMDKFRCFEAGVWINCTDNGAAGVQPWSACAPLVITATVTVPSKPTTVDEDCMRFRHVGSASSKEIEIDYIYFAASKVGAIAGTGDYIYQLPAGMSFDSTEQPLHTGPLGNAADIVAAARFAVRGNISGQVQSAPSSGSGGQTYVIPYDSTHFRLTAGIDTTTKGIGGNFQPLNQDSYTLFGRIVITIP